MSEFYGIDLGTTYSCISVLDEDDLLVVVPNKEGLPTTPSVVSFDDNGKVLVGKAAKAQLGNKPESTVAFIKREMSNLDFSVNIRGHKYDPVDISSYILKKLVDDANLKRYNEEGKDPINRVVISVPAYFGHTECERTKAAGLKAGLEVMSLIHEPTAAALSYTRKQKGNKTFLVYDLGGGTFDVSILKLSNHIMDTLSTDGDHHLGGVDWDMAIIRYALDKKKLGVSYANLTKQEQGMLRIAAEECKQNLSEQDSAVMQFAYKGIQSVEITKKEFEELTEELMERTMMLVDNAMKLAGNPLLDEVLLVGGSSRMPMVRKAVEAKFSITPKLVDPDMAVAKGAALFAGQEDRGEVAAGGVQLRHDKGSKSYGMKSYSSQRGKHSVFNLILRTDNLEVEKEFVNEFFTLSDGQECVAFHFYEGESVDYEVEVDEKRELKGKENLIRWGHPVPKGTPITIKAVRDKSGIVRVFAECQGAKGEFEIVTPGCTR